jgi:hypothetical protein
MAEDEIARSQAPRSNTLFWVVVLSAFFLWAAFHMTGGTSVITGFGIVVGFAGLIVVVTIGSMRLLTWGLRSILNGPKTPPPPSPMSAPLRAGRRLQREGAAAADIKGCEEVIEWVTVAVAGMSAVAPRCIDQTPPTPFWPLPLRAGAAFLRFRRRIRGQHHHGRRRFCTDLTRK